MAKQIFVVDDERCIADTLAVILRNSGYRASAFYDAETALKAAEFLLPELVISDVMMPEMNGIEMAVLLRERHPECKILLFSGQAAAVGMLESVRREGYDFELLAKPVHPKDLLTKELEAA